MSSTKRFKSMIALGKMLDEIAGPDMAWADISKCKYSKSLSVVETAQITPQTRRNTLLGQSSTITLDSIVFYGVFLWGNFITPG
jgi:hypothetical protein